MFDVFAESGRRAMRFLRNYMDVARRVKEYVMGIDEEARVYVFGSVVEGRYTASSDIDILIVSDKIPPENRAEVKAEIKRLIGLDAPIQLHIASRREYESWYSRFIGKRREV